MSELKDLICKMMQCKKVDDPAEKYADLLRAAKNVRRVAVYKTLAIQALGEAIDQLEGLK